MEMSSLREDGSGPRWDEILEASVRPIQEQLPLEVGLQKRALVVFQTSNRIVVTLLFVAPFKVLQCAAGVTSRP